MNLQAISIISWPILYILLLHCLFKQTNAVYEQYQFTLPLEFHKLCPNNDQMCLDGKPHFLCPARNVTPCNPFQYIPVVGQLKTSFIMGHNGIRNKVAEDWHIANMNLVHWSSDLAVVASIYLRLCELNADYCSNVGSDPTLIINQNYAIRHLLTQRWPGRIVRGWYLEISYDVQSFELFMKYRKKNNVANFTQMVWPELEFIGCSAASIKNSFYLIVCYYYPAVQEENITKVFKFGKPCTKCMKSRNACSLTFLGLCGLDVDLPSSACKQLYEIYYIILISCLLFLANKLFFK